MSKEPHTAILQRIGQHDQYNSIILDKNQMILGRDVDSQCRIDSVRISRKHALFRCEKDNQWTVTDLKSVNGICVNSKKLASDEPVVLKNGDIIRFGPEFIEVDFEYIFIYGGKCAESPSKAIVSKLKKENKVLVDKLAHLENEFKHKEEEMQKKISDKVAQLEAETKSLTDNMKTKFEQELLMKEKKLRSMMMEQQRKIIQASKNIDEKLNGEDSKNMQSVTKAHLREKKKYYEKALTDREVTRQLFEDELCDLTKSGEEQSSDALKARAKVLEEFSTLMEIELECAICTELFINAVTVNCSHSFCQFCLNQWKSKGKSTCPTCTAEIKTESKSVVLDSFIDTVTSRLPLEKKIYRQNLISERLNNTPAEDEKETKEEKTSRKLRRYCHCGTGESHLRNNCHVRSVRRSKRSRY